MRPDEVISVIAWFGIAMIVITTITLFW